MMQVDDNTCSICIDTILDTDKMVTSCNHIFHKECLNKWLQINNQCPYCRTIQYVDVIPTEPTPNITNDNLYPFAMYPVNYQPSGTVNRSNQYNLSFNHPISEITSFAQSYNVLRLMAGRSGLTYSS